jgi:hypothetical protein
MIPKLLQCEKCGDPTPWHRDTCELKWSVKEREATARFNSEAEALDCARRLLAQPDTHSVQLYDTEGGLTRPIIKESGPTTWNMENILTDALAAYAEEAGKAFKVRTYEDAGMLTRDKGLVVEVEGSKFQITIVKV